MSYSARSSQFLVWCIGAALAAYLLAAAVGLPQRATAAQLAAGHVDEVAHVVDHPPFWTIVPFAALLLAIAVLPLLPGISHWWEHNQNKLFVAVALAIVALAYYAFLHESAVVRHWPAERLVEPNPQGPNWAVAAAMLANALLFEYLPFIVLLLTLYTIAGGIRISGDLRATPAVNAAFLAIGAMLANFIGTTGAAMVLIRPLLDTNRQRRRVAHTVVFFIFAVCNCGGCLLPIGDPPLFLGYLRGVPFLWTLRLWPEWLFVNVLLVAIYYLFDRLWHYPRELAADIRRDERRHHALRIAGLWPNGALLLGVVLSVGLLDPSKPLPLVGWHPWIYLREAVQLALVAVSLLVDGRSIRQENQFNYHPIVEVAALFLGIFVCMQPALQILHVRGPSLGLASPAHFFWVTGSLSAVLDNAPTYVVFLETARSLGGQPTVAGVQEALLVAVSLGAVFMGAMTYIGNGPNFMVKAIAERAGVPMPSFFGYIVYSVLVLLPLFALTSLLFL